MFNQEEQVPSPGQVLQQKLQQQQRQYENYEIKYNNQLLDEYEIIGRLGKGKFCTVFKGISNRDGSEVAVKVLVPVREAKIKREIKILTALKQCPNSIKLHGVTYDPASKRTCFIFPYIHNKDIRELLDQDITLPRIKKYMHQILKGLKHAHSLGIYHRDIKPENILYNPLTQEALIADWGLGQFYFPGRVQSLKMGSRSYKAPQLLLSNQNYNCLVDIWSLGCVFGALIFYKNVLFRGCRQQNQIQKIAEIVGTEEIKAYVTKFKLQPVEDIKCFLNSKQILPKKPWTDLIYERYKETATESAIDLLSKMLVIDHTQRITAQQALNHPFFTENL